MYLVIAHTLPRDQSFHSPYLPGSDVLLTDDGYIYYNAEKPVRGRLEHSFFEIGLAVLSGGTIGALQGYHEGKRAARDHQPELRRVVMFNHIVKKSSLGNSLGILATIYATLGVAMSEIRGTDGPANTMLAASLTGLIYRIPGGFHKMAYGGLTGLTIGSALALWQGRDSLRDRFKYFLDTA